MKINSEAVKYHFTNEKAGMTGLDKNEINRIIYETTKDSPLQKKKEDELEKTKKLVEELQTKLEIFYKNKSMYCMRSMKN